MFTLFRNNNIIYYSYHRILTIYSIKINEFVCSPNISETIAVGTMKLAHRPGIASTTIKLISKSILLSILSIFIKNNSANRHWPQAKIVAAICLFTVIRPTLFSSVSWKIWCCNLADQFVLYYFLFLSVYSYGELKCDGLLTFIYISTPLLRSTHKPVLERDPSSIYKAKQKIVKHMVGQVTDNQCVTKICRSRSKHCIHVEKLGPKQV